METSGSLQKNLILGESGPTSLTIIPDIQAKFCGNVFKTTIFKFFSEHTRAWTLIE